MKKRYWILIVVIIGIVAFLLLRKNSSESYSSHVVARTDVSDKLLLAGTIDAGKRVDLGFAASGRIKKVNFDIGDPVKKGAVIAEIEQNRLSADLTQAQANYTLARVETRTDVSSARDSLEKQVQEQNTLVEGLYREYLTGDLQAYSLNPGRTMISPVVTGNYTGVKEGEYILDVYGSKAPSGYSFTLSGLGSGTHTARSNVPGELGDNGLFIQFNPTSSYGNSDWVVPVPNTRSAGYNTRKRAYESAVATRDRVIADLENNIARVSGTDTQSQITRDQARRDQARAQVNAVAAQLGDGKIRAPFDGIVAQHEMEVGEIVNGFTTQVTVFADNTKKLRLNTPEIYINKIGLGDMVSIELDAYPDEIFSGTVSFIDVIDTEVDGVPVYKTDILLGGFDDRIRVGMNAKATIIAEEKKDVLAIPQHYIDTNSEGISSVMIQEQERPLKASQKNVTLGFKGNDGFVEIIDGLVAGDVIILNTK